MQMKIMGLDLSITSTGVCLPDGSVIALRPKRKGDDRLGEIRDHIRLAVRTSGADLVVIESIQGRGLKGDAAIIIPMLHGVIRVMLRDEQVPFVLVNQSTLKRYATGNGNADKTAMAMAAYKRARVDFADDRGGDKCDAWWLYAAGMEHTEQLLFILPLAQRQALELVDWSPVPVAPRFRTGAQTGI
jgi:Holliday junction resolvasome RuvABC endonuclease subunit